MEGNACRWLGSQRLAPHQALCCGCADPGHLLHSSSPKSVGSSEGHGVLRGEVWVGMGGGLPCPPGEEGLCPGNNRSQSPWDP